MNLLRVTFLGFSLILSISFWQSGSAAGAAAYYSPSYSVAWWEQTFWSHVSWGNAVAGAQPDANGFYCVKPGMLVGEQLYLVSATGVSAVCTIGDMVQSAHVASWESKWVVEVSWNLFIFLQLDQINSVEVSYAAPMPEPEPVVTEWYFEETGQTVSGEFWKYWSRLGFDTAVETYGYPISGVEKEESGLSIQKFERAILEYHEDGVIRARRVVAQFLGEGPRRMSPVAVSLTAGDEAGLQFSQTGYSASGPFLAYWSHFGDEATSIEVFGYPISDPYHREDGMLVQKFERHVMEYHPDREEGQRILLTRVVAEMTAVS